MINPDSRKGFQLPFIEINVVNDRNIHIVKIISEVSDQTELIDKRLYHNFAKFGNVIDVARQYGVKFKKVKEGMEFSAPRSRLQMFVEKLHFSQTPFREI
jgi:hypothetical protein